MKIAALVSFLNRLIATTDDLQIQEAISRLISCLHNLPTDELVSDCFTFRIDSLQECLRGSDFGLASAGSIKLFHFVEANFRAFAPLMKHQDKSAVARLVDFLGLATSGPSASGSNDNAPALPQDPVLTFVDRLRASEADRQRFVPVHADLVAAKATLSPEQLDQIARAYTSSRRKSRSKKDAIERIERHFEVGAQHAARMVEISKIR